MNMDTSSVGFQRAKRRYKVLVREKQALLATSRSDAMVDEEIRKLENEFPMLLGDEKPSQNISNVVSSELTAFVPEVVKGSSATCHVSGEEATFNMVGPVSSLAERPDVQHRKSTDATPSAVPKKFSELERYKMLMFALQVFTAAHQRSRLGRINCTVIALLSVTIAVVHRAFIDPTSSLGCLLNPSLLCLLVHANNVCGAFLTRRRFSVPIFVVYLVLDVIPSLGMCIAFYGLTMIFMNLCRVNTT